MFISSPYKLGSLYPARPIKLFTSVAAKLNPNSDASFLTNADCFKGSSYLSTIERILPSKVFRFCSLELFSMAGSVIAARI